MASMKALEATEASPADRVVSLAFNYQGVMHAVTTGGRIFVYEHDGKNFNPGVHMRWTEITGPVL